MNRPVRRRLIGVSCVISVVCLFIFFVLHDSLSSTNRPPNVDPLVLAMYNHETRKPKPKTTKAPTRPQIHIKTIPAPKVHINMSMRVAEHQFFSFLEDKSVRCENDIRLGNINDGGWNVCLSPPYSFKEPCIVFSFGTGGKEDRVGYDWQFDDSVSKIYGCRVLAFDPSMGEPNSRRSPLIEFKKIGIGPRNEVTKDGWQMKTLGTHLKDEGYWGVPVDYVKIDVENDEWDSLQTAMDEGALQFVKQLGFEIHSRHYRLFNDWKEMEREKERIKKDNKVTRELEEKLDFVHMYETIRRVEIQNFRKFNYRKNPLGAYTSNFTKKGRSCCYELHYINTDFLNENLTVSHDKDSKLFH